MSTGTVDRVNQATMGSLAAVSYYGAQDRLTPAETAVLAAARGAIEEGPVLDLGVGGGRTTSHLVAWNKDYRGIDYAPAMVDACRRRFPGVAFEQGDARALATAADASCGFVLFSCNGIGMVDYPGRKRIVEEVARVLRPGGMFAFSFHVLAQAPAASSFHWPPFEFSFNPAKALVRALRFGKRAAVRLRNRRRLLPFEERAADYAVVNDPSQDYGTMLCYMSREAQLRQLREAGFTGGPRLFALDGRELAENEPSEDDSLMALVRR